MTASSTTTGFEDFYRSRAAQLFRYATVVAGRGQAEDACQEAWLRMWRAWGSADDDRLDAWARRVVRNCCLDRLQTRPDPLEWDVDGPALDPQPDDLVVRREEAAAVSRCVGRLPAHLREVLWLREMAEMSYAEIAGTLGIPIGTVMSRLHSARRKLARKLAG